MDVNKHTERERISRILAGETDLFRQIVDEYQDRVAAVCFNMMKDHNLAEEVGQETFIRLFRSLDKFQFGSSLGTYITRIAINLSLNKLDSIQRRRNRFEPQTDGHNQLHSNESNIQTRMENKELVQLALQGLTPEARSVVVLRMIEGYPVKETAEILGIAEGTVMSKLNRAMKKMKEVLTNYK